MVNRTLRDDIPAEGVDPEALQIDAGGRFVATPELEAELLEASAECDRGEMVSAEEFFRELDKR